MKLVSGFFEQKVVRLFSVSILLLAFVMLDGNVAFATIPNDMEAMSHIEVEEENGSFIVFYKTTEDGEVIMWFAINDENEREFYRSICEVMQGEYHENDGTLRYIEELFILEEHYDQEWWKNVVAIFREENAKDEITFFVDVKKVRIDGVNYYMFAHVCDDCKP